MEAKNIFDIGVLKYIKDAEISKKEEKFLNIKNYKFIDSTSNELYFYLIDYIIKVVIQANDFDIEKIFKLDKTQIKKEVSSAFKYFEKSLVHIYESNQYFIK
ncbi:TPA: hypothetical protein DEG21_06280 [Patescibacteria group bacterium]|nr:hypothetical protein [Candidatus Gracilibacteria bacterium]